MRKNRFATVAALSLSIALGSAVTARAQVQPGDVISPSNASKVENLVSPGNFALVKQGMTMKITPSTHLDWPPPYKAATEQYSAQVSLTPDGELKNYVAGLPFPLVDVNDPQAATKIMWNFTFRPLYTDDIDARNAEAVSHTAGSADEIEHFTFGHFGDYRYVGRTEVAPMPVDPDVLKTGIASRAGVYPVLDPVEMRGAGIVRRAPFFRAWKTPCGNTVQPRASCGVCRLPSFPMHSEFPGAGVPRGAGATRAPRPSPPHGIPIPHMALLHASRTTTTGCLASSRC